MDKMKKYLAYDKSIRLYVIEATDTVQEIKRRQNSSREITAALGRIAMATTMIGAMSSNDVKIYTRFEGNGPAGVLFADSDALGHVRAYANNPQVELPANERGKLDVKGVVGTDGYMYVMKDYGFTELQRSQSQIVSGEIAEDFAHFFTVSEQVPSAVGLGVLTDDERVERAYGFIAQVLPDCPDEVIGKLEENILAIPSILEFFKDKTIEDFAMQVSGGTAKELEEIPVEFKCSCSKERFLEAFYSLPVEELEEMVNEDGTEEVVCNYCNNKYEITNEEIQEIVNDKK